MHRRRRPLKWESLGGKFGRVGYIGTPSKQLWGFAIFFVPGEDKGWKVNYHGRLGRTHTVGYYPTIEHAAARAELWYRAGRHVKYDG